MFCEEGRMGRYIKWDYEVPFKSIQMSLCVCVRTHVLVCVCTCMYVCTCMLPPFPSLFKCTALNHNLLRNVPSSCVCRL
jgi:hypothetical protein